VEENARDLKIEFLSELYRVIIHGILHLCGYTDTSKAEKSKMRRKEDYYLSKI
jgi:rRNA maturation RNase YbeY